MSVILSSIRVHSTTFTKKISRNIFFKYVYRNVQNVNLKDIPNITATDIKKVLRQKGLAVQDSSTSIITKCLLCSGEQKEDESKVYINKTTGYFLCPKCNIHGDWTTLERIVKKCKLDTGTKELINKLNQETEQFAKEWQSTLKNTVPLNTLSESHLQELFKLFEYPFDLDIIKVFSDVRVNGERTTLIFPLKNLLDKVVGYRKVQAGNEDKPEYCGLHLAGLFKCKTTRSQRCDQAVLVPSFQDILNLAMHKAPGTLIWLSNCTLPPIMLPTLDVYQKLYLWGDWNNMRNVAEKLGEDRCFFIRPTDGLVTASEAASVGLSLKGLIAEAKPAAHRSITTFAALREDVYAELTNIDKVRGVKWRRFPMLTKLLGGHRRGELTVLTGPTGCGKTTLCAEMSLDLAQQGVTTLWGSFEIRNSRLARTMLQQFAGVPLEHNLQDFKKYADEFEKLPLYYLAFHGSQPIKVVMEAVEHARYMYDIAHVIVDNVQFMLGMGGVGAGDKNTETGDRFYKQDAVIAAFRTFATARHCHVTLVMHPRKERDSDDLSTSSIFGGAKASQEADNVLIIQDKRLTTVRGKKYLQVAKNRYSGDLGIVPLEFDKDSLSYQAKKKSKAGKNEEGIPSKSESIEPELQKEYFSNYDDMITDRKVIHVGKTGLYKNKNAKLDDATDNYLRELLNLDKNR